MSNRDRRNAWLIAFLVVAGGALVGYMAYNAGVAHGIAESGRWAATPGAPPPYMYWRPWGFGFGFFPFLLLLFFFFGVRRLLWGGRGWGYGGYYRDGVPPGFDEWHRRAHERDSPVKSPIER